MHAQSPHGRTAARVSVRSKKTLNKALGAVIEPLEQRALLSAPGDPLGTVLTDFGGNPDVGGHVVRIPGSQKLLQVGTTTANGPTDFALAQFDETGSPDLGFGTGGQWIEEFPSIADFTLASVNAVAVVADNPLTLADETRIVVVGVATHTTVGDPDWLIAVFTADGNLDSGFSADGVRIDNFRFDDNLDPVPDVYHANEARAVALQADPDDGNAIKIIVAGSDTFNGSFEGFAVARYLLDGTLDTTFSNGDTDGINGVAENPFPSATLCVGNSTDALHAVAVDQEQKIVLAGSTFVSGCDQAPFIALQRFTPSGALDLLFGGDGMVTANVGATPEVSGDVAYAVDVDATGEIIVAGTTDSSNLPNSQDFLLVRFSNGGTPDSTTTTSFELVATVDVALLSDLAFQADGKIVVGGSVIICDEISCNLNFAVGRYTAAGVLDQTFNASGPIQGIALQPIVLDDTPFPDQHLVTIAIQDNPTGDGDVVALGNWIPVDATPGDFAVDDTGDSILSRYVLTVNDNTPPTVAPITGPSSGVRSFSQTFSSSFVDPDADSWTVSWNFGDSNSTSGSASPGSISASHIYTAIGTYSVTVTVDDNVNAPVVVDSFTISITTSGLSGGVLQIGGDGANDNISVKNSMGSIVVTDNGANTTYNGLNTIMIAGGDGNDDIRINPNVTQSVIVFGGAGNDSIKGGANADILVGGDGDDLLHGQDGRDLLIGSKGADRIIGHADDDILVAGYTNYDLDIAALQAILSEWTSTRTYQQRVDNVMGNTTGGNNGSYILKPYDSQTNNADATAFDDGDVDILTGNSGQDLFMFNSDLAGQDSITDLSAAEFAPDLDWILNP
jgi:uncharacterized delta-60 repeat protein